MSHESFFTQHLRGRRFSWLAALPFLLPAYDASAQVASGLIGASGSTVGPDGALYVTESVVGRVTRIDVETGATSTFAMGLPPAVLPVGGAVDVAFLDGVAYVLVTMVGFPFGANVDGLYRVDGPSSFTVVADIGAYSTANPPATAFDLASGVQYALEPYRGGFLVTDGHLNRILRVRRDGTISVFNSFGNIVPTGMEIVGDTVLMAQAGPVPHLPQAGKVVAIEARSGEVTEVAAGGPLMIDVERGRGMTLYALAQGPWNGQFPGSPAQPNSGALHEIQPGGALRTIAAGINLPTSLEVIGNTGYVVTMTGEVWAFDGLSAPPFGAAR